MKASFALATVLLALGAPARASAQSDLWSREVRASIETMSASLAEQGYRPRSDVLGGLLDAQEMAWLPIHLDRGGEHVIAATCDRDCTQLGLVLANEGRYEIVANRGAGRAPILRFKTGAAGWYRLRVIMEGCRVSPCRFGVRVFSRRAAGGAQ
ncbi:MAG TPA: hypothetical protein VMG41_06490 [Gemmatimonadales bacterium]|nr:hypothetical protein [Gemmatimonadales bacterium]